MTKDKNQIYIFIDRTLIPVKKEQTLYYTQKAYKNHPKGQLLVASDLKDIKPKPKHQANTVMFLRWLPGVFNPEIPV